MLPSFPFLCAWLLPAQPCRWQMAGGQSLSLRCYSGALKWATEVELLPHSTSPVWPSSYIQKGGISENRASISPYLPMWYNMHGHWVFSFIQSAYVSSLCPIFYKCVFWGNSKYPLENVLQLTVQHWLPISQSHEVQLLLQTLCFVLQPQFIMGPHWMGVDNRLSTKGASRFDSVCPWGSLGILA